MPRLCLNTDVFKRCRLEQAIQQVAAAGYRHVTLNAVPFWEPHVDFSAPDAPTQVQALGRLLDQHDLHLVSVETATSLSAWDEMERAESIAYCKRAIELLAPLGCQIASVSGAGTNLFSKCEQQEILKGSLRELSAFAATHGMELTIDIYPGSCLEVTAEAIQILDDLNLPNVRYMLCVPHVASLGEDLAATYALAKGHLRHLIIADTPQSTVNHLHLIPGTGSVDFRPLFAALQQDQYDRCLTVQIYTYMDNQPLENAIRAREATERLWQSAVDDAGGDEGD